MIRVAFALLVVGRGAVGLHFTEALRKVGEGAISFTRPRHGVITKLPAMTDPAATEPPGDLIHGWHHDIPGYRLECRLLSVATKNPDIAPLKFSARLLFRGVELERLQVVKFDGEFTKSVTIRSTNSSLLVVDYTLTSGGGCRRRTYVVEGQGYRRDSEGPCEAGSTLAAITTTANNAYSLKFRKNGWHWNQKKSKPPILGQVASYKPESWKGAIETLPTPTNKVELSGYQTLHTWKNTITGYELTLKREAKASGAEAEYYVDVIFDPHVAGTQPISLEKNIKINRFDDYLLSSITVYTPVAPPNTAVKDDLKKYSIQFKMFSGKCTERSYQYEPSGPGQSSVVLQASEKDCRRILISDLSASLIYNQVTSLVAVNGWKW